MPTANNMEDVVMRILPAGDPIGFKNLGLSPHNQDIVDRSLAKPYGLILVVGPTGSGKTTTLHSAVAQLNKPETKIWTAEDPVELTQAGLRQVQVNPRIGFTFATALRSFLRLDPDIILVGEMRDVETATICIEAALTGHLVMSTLHTNTAPETVIRLLEMGLDPFSFSDSLVAIIAQRLARQLCPDCKETYTPTADELAALVEEYGPEAFDALGMDLSGISLARIRGCAKCAQTGYRGRIGIHEVLEATEPIRRLIRKKCDSEEVRNLAVSNGMMTLKQDGIRKVLEGITDIQEVRRVCLV
jgi:type II secretory ATPase GspE/PulE/Tfp pilus assembly ATPase PilB-like protein